MAEGNLLMKKCNSDGILYAITVLLFKDESVELAVETSSGDGSFKLNYDKAYRLICDIKNKLEVKRVADIFASKDDVEEEEEEFDI